MTITKSQYQRYERVRRSGVTNMFDVRRVMKLAALTREQCIAIMQDYSRLKEQFEHKIKETQ
jgi:aryl-alcohol dehydrogenase-like predicted oxidoreductase